MGVRARSQAPDDDDGRVQLVPLLALAALSSWRGPPSAPSAQAQYGPRRRGRVRLHDRPPGASIVVSASGCAPSSTAFARREAARHRRDGADGTARRWSWGDPGLHEITNSCNDAVRRGDPRRGCRRRSPLPAPAPPRRDAGAHGHLAISSGWLLLVWSRRHLSAPPVEPARRSAGGQVVGGQVVGRGPVDRSMVRVQPAVALSSYPQGRSRPAGRCIAIRRSAPRTRWVAPPTHARRPRPR